MLDTPCGAQIGEQERIIMMKTTTLLLALTLFVPSLFAGPKPKPGTEAQILERLHNKKLRLLLRVGPENLPENFYNPFRVKYDGFLIIGPTRRFVDETIEGLQRIQKYAPEHYAMAKKHVMLDIGTHAIIVVAWYLAERTELGDLQEVVLHVLLQSVTSTRRSAEFEC